MAKVFLGVGHGGTDPGASGQIVEKNANLIMALACREYLENKGLTFLSADVSLIPQSYVDLDDDKYAVFQKMLDELENNDDVQDVYHNVNVKD